MRRSNMFQAYCTTSMRRSRAHSSIWARRKLDTPIKRALPCRTTSSSARIDSSSGVCGSGQMHEIDVDMIGAQSLQTLVDRGEDEFPATVAAVRHFLVADAEFGRDDDVVAAASECPRQRLLGHAHAIGLGRVETDDAAIDRLRDRPLELALVNSTVGAADLPTPEADCGHLQAGSPELPELHRRLSHCAAMAADGVAKRCSMSRRVRNAALSGTSTSTQRTTAPAAMLRLSGSTLCASPIGSAPSARLRSAGTSLPQTVYPPSPSSVSPACNARLATATTSPRQPLAWPVGSPRSAAASTEMPSSSPIKW